MLLAVSPVPPFTALPKDLVAPHQHPLISFSSAFTIVLRTVEMPSDPVLWQCMDEPSTSLSSLLLLFHPTLFFCAVSWEESRVLIQSELHASEFSPQQSSIFSLEMIWAKFRFQESNAYLQYAVNDKKETHYKNLRYYLKFRALKISFPQAKLNSLAVGNTRT